MSISFWLFFVFAKNIIPYEPADKILDRGKGRDYVHKGAKGKGTCNI